MCTCLSPQGRVVMTAHRPYSLIEWRVCNRCASIFKSETERDFDQEDAEFYGFSIDQDGFRTGT